MLGPGDIARHMRGRCLGVEPVEGNGTAHHKRKDTSAVNTLRNAINYFVLTQLEQSET